MKGKRLLKYLLEGSRRMKRLLIKVINENSSKKEAEEWRKWIRKKSI